MKRMPRIGFRTRVLGLLAVVLVLAIGSGLIIQRITLMRMLDTSVTGALEQERDELATLAAGVDPQTGEPFGPDARAILDTFFARNVPDASEAYFAIVDGAPYKATLSPIRFDRE